MKKYLYLSEPWMAKTWIEGGPVPLSVASAYRSKERMGIHTPDENQLNDYSTDPHGYIDIEGGMTVRGCLIIDNPWGPGRVLNGKQWVEDGLVLCLSSAEPHWDTMQRLGKKCCVRIEDVDFLKAAIDQAVGTESEMRACEYTWGHLRGAFLKSREDAWQSEFRLYWRDQKAQEVMLPAGIASAVKLWKGMWHSGTFFR